jgi:arabinogalactan endo-1,4-beta-galactosidase
MAENGRKNMGRRKWLQRGLAIALTAAMCFGLAPTDNLAGLFTVSAEESTNLLTNGDFTNDISGWTLNDNLSGADMTNTLKMGSTSGRTGNGLYIVNGGTADCDAYLTQKIASLEAGTYKLTAYVMGKGYSGAKAIARDGAGSWIDSVGWQTDASAWSEVSYEFTLNEAAENYVVGLNLWTYKGGTWNYIDDISLVKTDADNSDDSKDDDDNKDDGSAETADAITITPSAATVEAGKSIDFTATVTYGGKTLTADDLGSNFHLYWWADQWQTGHENGKTDITTVGDDTLSPTITFPSAGTYYLVTELQDSSCKSLKKVYTTITVTAKEEAEEEDTSVEADINVDKVSGLSKDFIMGMDISSVMSEFASGVTYQDFDRNTIDNITDFCKFLASCGVTTVRVRVWNDPKDSAGNSYGGGANDVDTAVEIAKGCKEAGLDMLIDFHCSDFWTDPGKQQAPKAWAGYTLEKKKEALTTFITESLNKITATGATVSMVQVGNETTSGFIGETSVENMCALFSAGAAAVRAAVPSSKVVIHVTNPEKSNMTTWAKNLADNNVEYDVLATSYYPSWHGTFANLKSQLQAVKATYGVDVMVAETSYAYTLEDTDGHTNTIRLGTADTMMCETQYPFSVQGQASYLRDLIDVVNEAGGIGVFYWEPAWITVGDTTNLSETESVAKIEANKALWETNGSGWASSYATEYDPNDAGKYYGGSAVDNQALFAADGSPLASINIWSLVKTGAVSRYTSVESIASGEETIEAGGSYALPETVTVTYNKGEVAEKVSWNEADVKKIDTETIGTYVVNGTVTFSKAVNDGDYSGKESAQVTYTLTVKAKNLIGDDWSFENGGNNFKGLGSTGKGIDGEDPLAGDYCLHWYLASASEATVTYLGSDQNGITLEPGKYTFGVQAQGYAGKDGGAGDTVTLSVLEHDSEDSKPIEKGDEIELTGYLDWQNPTVSFVITKETTVDLQMNIGIQAGGWGTIDCMYLYQTEKYYTVDSADGETLTISANQIEIGTNTDEEESGDVPNTSLASTEQELLDAAVFTPKELEALAADPELHTTILLAVADQKDGIEGEEKECVDNTALKNGYTVDRYLAINLHKLIGDDDVLVTKLAAPISIAIELPEDLINKDSTKTRTYGIIRIHKNDETGELESTLLAATEEDGILTFQTDRFSTYAIVYKDTAVSTEEPKQQENQNQQNKTDTTKTNAAETVSTADTTANTAPDASAATTAKVTSADTGDTAPVIPYLILFAAAFVLVAAMGYRRRSAK